MLQDFREGIRGIAIWLVVLIAIPFVFVGVDSFFSGDRGRDGAVIVNGEEIGQSEIDRAVAIRKQNLMAQMPDADPSQLDDADLRGPVQQELILEKLLVHAAKENSLAVSPETVADMLRKEPAFQTDAHFDRQKYEFLLRQMGYTPQSYSALLKNRILAAQLANGISATGFSTEPETKSLIQLVEQRRNFAYLIIPGAPAIKQMEVSADEIEMYYNDHQSSFQTEETAVVDYIEIKPDDLLGEIKISDADIRNQYSAEQAQTSLAERRRVAHILVIPKVDKSHLKTLEEIKHKLAKGEDFASIARAYSDDSGTASDGGDLGFMEPGAFPEAFEKAVAALHVNEVSTPVTTDSGIHLIKLLALEKPNQPSFDEQKARIKKELQQQRVGELLPDKVGQLKELSYNAEHLADVAKTLNLTAKVSAPFSRRGGEGIAAFPAVVAAAFSDDVLENGYTSDVLELADGHMIVIKLREHSPAALLPLSAVRDQIEDRLKADKAQAVLEARSKLLAARIRAGETIEQVARSENLDWQTSLESQRFSEGVNTDVRETAFALPASSELPAVDSVMTSQGDRAVLSVTAIIPGDTSKLTPQESQQLEMAAVRSVVGREYHAYESGLLAEAKVVQKN